ncbi:MAG: hypothetical protein WDN46_05225 [Methylocella sp.]
MIKIGEATGGGGPDYSVSTCAEWDAMFKIAETVPTTLAGIIALCDYLLQVGEFQDGIYDGIECTILESIRASLRNIPAA